MTEAVSLDAEDRHRMARLYEEVLVRLEEMIKEKENQAKGGA